MAITRDQVVNLYNRKSDVPALQYARNVPYTIGLSHHKLLTCEINEKSYAVAYRMMHVETVRLCHEVYILLLTQNGYPKKWQRVPGLEIAPLGGNAVCYNNGVCFLGGCVWGNMYSPFGNELVSVFSTWTRIC